MCFIPVLDAGRTSAVSEGRNTKDSRSRWERTPRLMLPALKHSSPTRNLTSTFLLTRNVGARNRVARPGERPCPNANGETSYPLSMSSFLAMSQQHELS
ncbi:hypothetical protein VUR80DRAFT_3205 [Thermomyces stellatus]